MSKPVRFGSVVSLLALSSMIAACAAQQGRTMTAGSRVNGDVALGVRAAAALDSNDYATAVSLAERAAAKTPRDAALRTLLGNAYFASGRFASAESAYKDSLFVESNQPGVILKLVLVEIAQGKTAEAMTFLDAGRDVLDPADYGLALALAGRPEAGVAVLQPAARSAEADSRVRENLALAYALSGDWANARAIAAQDVPADQLDGRMQQWMQLASPHRSSDQVAALVGVRPAASDPGQPVQLALAGSASRTRLAAAAPVAAPAPVAAFAAAAPAASVTVGLPPARPAPVAVAQSAPVPAPVPVPTRAPRSAPAPLAASLPIAPLAPMLKAPVDVADLPFVPVPRAAEAALVVPALLARAPHQALPGKSAPMHLPAPAPNFVATGNSHSDAVVQLGAYASPQRVAAAWSAASKRFAALRRYAPTSARFDSPRGTVYRLSLKGFDSYGEANAVCASLRRSGGTCFVRNFAGDAPVQIAMR